MNPHPSLYTKNPQKIQPQSLFFIFLSFSGEFQEQLIFKDVKLFIIQRKKEESDECFKIMRKKSLLSPYPNKKFS